MKRPVATLDLPEFKINEFHKRGFIFCEDVSIEEIAADVNITAEEWRTLTTSVGTKSALELCQEESILSNIVTFSKSLDEALGGGVPIRAITEFCGLPGSGKTQICLQLCVSVQIPDCFGGIEGHAVYIDTKFGFSPDRIIEITKGALYHCNQVANTYNSFDMITSLNSLTEENILHGIHYIQVSKIFELLALVNSIKKLLLKDPKIKLVIIDNITNPVKVCNLEYFERIKLLYSFLSNLQELASHHNFAIVLTNNMTTKFDSNGQGYETPSLGDSYGHRINNRIFLERKSDEMFTATVLKSVMNNSSKINFKISEAGIRDVDN